jgi:23S rRNA (uracil1939-C5)-methyltransferase
MARIILKCNYVNNEGIGISTYNNLPIYIPNFLTNEEAEVQIVHKGYQKYFGKILRLLSVSKDRVNPECRYYGICGGCQLQHMSYEAQLKFKVDYVKELFATYNLEFPFENIYKAENSLFYRHKILAPIENNERGFYKLQTKEFVKTKTCLIENYLGQKIINKILEFNLNDLTYIYIRVGKYIDNVLLTFVTKNEQDIISKTQINEF